MRKLFFSALLLSAGLVRAQNGKPPDSVDDVIIARFITPAEQQAGVQEPEWAALREQIRASYLDIQADRAITRAQIYFYCNQKNWSGFSAAIVHYVETYADKEDLELMNRNANFILERSTDPEQLKMALSWISHAMIKEPSNIKYRTTFEALSEKINTQ